MKNSHSLTGLVLCAGLLALGCDKGKTEGAGSTASGSGEAKGASGDAAEVKAVCAKMCDKAVECAVVLAKEAAKGGGDDETVKRAIAEAETSAKENLADCKQSCNRAQITDTDRAQVAEAKLCLGLADCTKFMQCIERVGTGTKK
jgi:hypothetical protein